MIISLFVVWTKSYVMSTIIFVLPRSKLETVLMETVGGCLIGEPQTYVSCISNAPLLSLNLLLPAAQNTSFKKWLHELFLNEDSNISTMIFYSQHRIEHTCWVKKELLFKVISLSTRQTFFFLNV